MIWKILISMPLLAAGAVLVLTSWGFLLAAREEGNDVRQFMGCVFGFVFFTFAILSFATLFWLWGL